MASKVKITIPATSSYLPVEYSLWQDGEIIINWQSSNIFENVDAGRSYICKVRDDAGCIAEKEFFAETDPPNYGFIEVLEGDSNSGSSINEFTLSNQDLEEGDYMLVFIAVDLEEKSITPPLGFDLIDEGIHPENNDLNIRIFAGFWEPSMGNEFVFSISSTSVGTSMAYFFRGVNKETPIYYKKIDFTLNGLENNKLFSNIDQIPTQPKVGGLLGITVSSMKPVSGTGEYVDTGIVPTRFTWWQSGTDRASVHGVLRKPMPLSRRMETYDYEWSSQVLYSNILLYPELTGEPAWDIPIETFRQGIFNAFSDVSVGYNYAVYKDGLLYDKHSHGYYKYKDENASDDSVWMINSLSKLTCVAGILMLHEEGLIDIYDNFYDYVKEDYPSIGREVGSFRIIDLLRMRAGVGSSGRPFNYTTSDFYGEVENYINIDAFNTPGFTYNYQNGSFALLQIVVEKVTGRGYFEWLNENLFQPYGIEFFNQPPAGGISGYNSGTSTSGATMPVPASEGFGRLYVRSEEYLKFISELEKLSYVSKESLDMVKDMNFRSNDSDGKFGNYQHHGGAMTIAGGTGTRSIFMGHSDRWNVILNKNTSQLESGDMSRAIRDILDKKEVKFPRFIVTSGSTDRVDAISDDFELLGKVNFNNNANWRGIDAHSNKIYACARNLSQLITMDIWGGNPTVILEDANIDIYGVSYHEALNKVYLFDRSAQGAIWIMNPDGSDLQSIYSTGDYVSLSSIDVVENKIYASTGGRIVSLDLDGTNELLLTTLLNEGNLNSTTFDDNYIYFANIAGLVGRVNKDGTGAQQVYTVPSNNVTEIRYYEGRLYISDTANGKLSSIDVATFSDYQEHIDIAGIRGLNIVK